MREAPSLTLIDDLTAAGATVQRLRPGRGARRGSCSRTDVKIVDSALAALEGADALAIVTEWQEFRSPDFAAIKAKLKTPAIFDGRNLYDPRGAQGPGHRVLPDRAETHRHRRRPRVLVVGDVMLDRYWFGEVSRISPEAPVPVVLISTRGSTAGRRRQRGLELQGARRAHAAALGGRARRARPRAGEAAEEEGHRREPAPRRRACTPRRSCASSAAASSCCASISRSRRRARCWPPSSPSSRARSPNATW